LKAKDFSNYVFFNVSNDANKNDENFAEIDKK